MNKFAYQFIFRQCVKKYSIISKKYIRNGSINYATLLPEQECLFNGRPTIANKFLAIIKFRKL
ncbi:hypothetical protein HYD46_02900 [Mycoplasmopsis bovis]|nr:hypothetical protein [Mycoplasmopsis bovis]QQH78251.1 hypothetical protein HYD46_02900 [Mycoplasmopsis bovis]